MKPPTIKTFRNLSLSSYTIGRSALIHLILALALTGLSSVLLIRPVIGSGGSLAAPAPVLTVAISDASPVVEGNPSPSPSVTPQATFVVSLSAANPDPGPVTVDFASQSGTASEGSDYQSTSGNLSFAQGEQTKTITVPIIPDTQGEGNETFLMKLTNPQGINIAAGQDQATGTIVDDDPGGVLQFSQANFNVNENAGSATITVTRTLDLLGTVTVNFNTSNGSANMGQDYGHSAGTLTFGPGQTSKTFQVPIIDDATAEVSETVNLQLSGATNGATLGSQSSATLTILDNDLANDVLAVTVTNKLVKFNTDDPTITTVIGPITGLQPSEQIVGIDFRPANGQLYGLGGTGRLYTINSATAAATLVAALTADPSDATSPYSALSGTRFNIDFDPVSDRLRVVSDARQNLRVNPANGQVITDTNLAYGAGDTNFAANPNIVAAAYSNSFAGLLRRRSTT